MSDIVKQLRSIRQKQELSQEALAMSIGLTGNCGPAISRWENGIDRPKLDTITRWADALGYEVLLQKKGEQ